MPTASRACALAERRWRGQPRPDSAGATRSSVRARAVPRRRSSCFSAVDGTKASARRHGTVAGTGVRPPGGSCVGLPARQPDADEKNAVVPRAWAIAEVFWSLFGRLQPAFLKTELAAGEADGDGAAPAELVNSAAPSARYYRTVQAWPSWLRRATTALRVAVSIKARLFEADARCAVTGVQVALRTRTAVPDWQVFLGARWISCALFHMVAVARRLLFCDETLWWRDTGRGAPGRAAATAWRRTNSDPPRADPKPVWPSGPADGRAAGAAAGLLRTHDTRQGRGTSASAQLGLKPHRRHRLAAGTYRACNRVQRKSWRPSRLRVGQCGQAVGEAADCGGQFGRLQVTRSDWLRAGTARWSIMVAAGRDAGVLRRVTHCSHPGACGLVERI